MVLLAGGFPLGWDCGLWEGLKEEAKPKRKMSGLEDPRHTVLGRQTILGPCIPGVYECQITESRAERISFGRVSKEQRAGYQMRLREKPKGQGSNF